MLEQISLGYAKRLRTEQAITVVSRDGSAIHEYVLCGYAGFSTAAGSHLFWVRTRVGEMRVLTDRALGLQGDAATARFAEPERSADIDSAGEQTA